MPNRTQLNSLSLVVLAALAGTPALAQSMSRGILISSTQLAGAPAGAAAVRIRYQSRAVGGERNENTGVIIVDLDAAPRSGRDVVAWAHGTSGVANSSAPSQSKLLLGSIAGLNAMSANVDIGTSPPWAEQLLRDSIQPSGFLSPVLIAQGSADPIVAPAVKRTFAQALCRRRSVPVRYLAIEGGDYFSIGKRSADATVRWIADRFAGQAAPDDCGLF